jgi:sortase A
MIVVGAVVLGLQALAVLPSGPIVTDDPAVRCDVLVTIPEIDVREELRYYPGSPDDGRGTRIQDTGDLASPLGRAGGVRAGDVGNFFIAGHRTSAGGPLLHLRQLRRGDIVKVRTQCDDGSGGTHTYAITGKSRYIDFFTRKGRAAQIAPVPLQPGEAPTTSMVTLSTCATQEDRARGDRRTDRFGNPPGRWVVVGVLVSSD